MSSILKITLTVVVSMAIGYGLYPLLHKNPEAQHYISQEQEKALPYKHNSVVQTLPATNTPTTSNQAEGSISEVANEAELQPDSNEGDQENVDFVELDPEILEQQENLKRWSEGHRESLNEIILTNVSENISEKLLEIIQTDNQFINDTKLKQDPEKDEAWAYEMEQMIRETIEQHRFSTEVEVFSIVCKQLVCEMVTKEMVEGSWQSVYSSITRNVFMNLSETNRDKIDGFFDNIKNISLSENGETYIYSQVPFFEKN